MGLLDFIIIMFIFIIGSIGIKNGFFKQTVLTVGTVLVIVLAYVTKDFLMLTGSVIICLSLIFLDQLKD